MVVSPDGCVLIALVGIVVIEISDDVGVVVVTDIVVTFGVTVVVVAVNIRRKHLH